jgi:hypothetical protein
MALTLAQLQQRRDEILDEMGRASEVRFSDGRSVTQRPQTELDAALQRVDAEIAAMQSPQSRQFTVQTSRGL